MKKLSLLLLLPLLLFATETNIENPFRLGIGSQASKWGYGGSLRSWIKNRVGIDVVVQRNWDGDEEGGELSTMFNFAPQSPVAPYIKAGGGLTRVDLPEVGSGRNNGYLGYGIFGAGGEFFFANKRHGISLDASYNLGKLEYKARVSTGIGSDGTDQLLKEIKAEPYSISLAYHFYFVPIRGRRDKDDDESTRGDGTRGALLKDPCVKAVDDSSWFDNDSCPDYDMDDDGVLDINDKCPQVQEDRDGFEDGDGCPDEDNDGDQIKDVDDKCPDEPEDVDGIVDDDGCPENDVDGDGILDILDKCYMEAETFNGYKDEDGCPESDLDQDSVVDALDKCPDQPETHNDYNDDDGCPDTKPVEVADKDGDGIIGDLDKCPDEAETINGYQDEDGCPDKNPKKNILVTQIKREKKPTEQIIYNLNETRVNRAIKKILDKWLLFLEDFPEIEISIEGHTDSYGSEVINREISKMRAERVRKYLVKNGYDESKIEVVGHGASKPKYNNKTAQGRAQNRRVEIIIRK